MQQPMALATLALLLISAVVATWMLRRKLAPMHRCTELRVRFTARPRHRTPPSCCPSKWQDELGDSTEAHDFING